MGTMTVVGTMACMGDVEDAIKGGDTVIMGMLVMGTMVVVGTVVAGVMVQAMTTTIWKGGVSSPKFSFWIIMVIAQEDHKPFTTFIGVK